MLRAGEVGVRIDGWDEGWEGFTWSRQSWSWVRRSVAISAGEE